MMREQATIRFNNGVNLGMRPAQQAATNTAPPLPRTRQATIGLLLVVALVAFEVFNFDTTRFALAELLGPVSFWSVRWATILAVAFCAIDFAGLAHFFGPDSRRSGQQGTWYLMGAWLLGATMNALMTWWAVTLVLLDHPIGNEVLAREQLLQVGPIFVAVLVWLTRILFIGAFSIAGDRLFAADGLLQAAQPRPAEDDKVAERPVQAPATRIPAWQEPAPPRPTRPGVGQPQPMAAAPRRTR
jgi:hypothetical protein